MKKPSPSLFIGLVTALALCISSPRAPAQDETVTISAAEFQRTVYSAHLLTHLDEKPELDASLQVLLELHRRNPNADPALLAAVLQETTARYRTNAPSYIRASGLRDEVLASYLDALRQVSARTNFIPANLSLLNSLIKRAQAPTDEPQADMIHSGSQGLLASEGNLAQRQALLEACTGRAQGRADFRAAMDILLSPETLVSMSNSPAEIISNTNSPLHDNPTMQTLLGLSVASGDGSLTVSSNQLMTLFTNETQTFWDTINTNLALQREINQSQADLLAYLTNQPAMDASAHRLTVVHQGQPRRIASATAAVLVQSKLMAARDPLIKLPGQMQGCVEGLGKITEGVAAFAAKDATSFAKVAASGNILGGALKVFDVLFGGESPDEVIIREIGNIKILIGDLSRNMNYRFDRVDQSLTQIYETLNEQFEHLGGDVDQVRLALLDVQTSLFRVERNLATFHALDWRIELVEDMNYVRGFEVRAGHPMPYADNAPSDFLSYENAFFTHAFNRASLETLSRYTTLPFGDEYFYSQLSPGGATNVYAETLNYIKKCLRERLGLTASFPEQPVLANPQDWSAGAAAWLQLAVENPGYFRRYERDVGFPSRLEGIISKGRDLTNFFRSLTFTGTNINWPVYNALENFYVGKLTSYSNQVRSVEQRYAAEHGSFAVDTWRRWSGAAPRLVVTATEAMQTPGWNLPPIPQGYETNVVAVAAGQAHSLALKADGTVVAWGRNPYGPTTNVPAALNSVVAIAAGDYFSLALRTDGTLVAWGDNEWGQCNIPSSATNVVAVAAGSAHSLALKADGTVVAWGNNDWGRRNIPSSATNVVAIAAGYTHSLALKADGTVVAWSVNLDGETIVPSGLDNAVAVAAGYGHSLALRDDGTVVAWGRNDNGQATVPPALDRVVAIAAGDYHSLALRADGTVVGWGNNDWGQTIIPATNVIAVSGGGWHSVFLNATGTATPVGDSAPFFVRAQIPYRVGDLLLGVNGVVLTNLNFDLHGAAIELSGAKALLQAVVELGMPYTLEQDDVLHGFLYGSESLVDMEGSHAFLATEISRLATRRDAKPQALNEVAALRYLRLADRLEARLNDLAATGEPELPRLAGHTLRLLNLLLDAWNSTPPPALEIGRGTNSLNVLLYGEPYARYTLQYRDNLNIPGWTTTTVTNLHTEEFTILPASVPQRFYRALLPAP